jgi:predicted enzyme related to lactoylglutathione lyase
MERPLDWPTWIGVVAKDLEGQRRFWGAVLGIPEAAAGSDFVQWDLGGGRTFELVRRSDQPEYDRPRFQVGFAVDDIERAREELLGRGVEPITDVVDGDTSRWAYFRDPEGNIFEITERAEEE